MAGSVGQNSSELTVALEWAPSAAIVSSTFEGQKTQLSLSAWILPKANPSGVEGSLKVIGSNGILHLDRREEILVHVGEKGFQAPRTALAGEVNGRLQGSLKWSQEHFIGSIIEGKPPVIDAEDGYKMVEIACAIHRSIEEGKNVKLPL